ncbi:MAG: hypothetical protein OZSIB_2444 [Candidatus Ozemobacter sibiricus]|uniref:Uncharacterized protein n=1 Tax=Candidatus Ozemobacter sibiricus TaxID=2268124 RepID=A0A367ZT92_9BACT|nr:MAG: hypothetical protein OZSIB_2444 [Candidatus Ozemobacter sibiricus]
MSERLPLAAIPLPTNLLPLADRSGASAGRGSGDRQGSPDRTAAPA